jgi:hypothetical protein
MDGLAFPHRDHRKGKQMNSIAILAATAALALAAGAVSGQAGCADPCTAKWAAAALGVRKRKNPAAFATGSSVQILLPRSDERRNN